MDLLLQNIYRDRSSGMSQDVLHTVVQYIRDQAGTVIGQYPRGGDVVIQSITDNAMIIVLSDGRVYKLRDWFGSPHPADETDEDELWCVDLDYLPEDEAQDLPYFVDDDVLCISVDELGHANRITWGS